MCNKKYTVWKSMLHTLNKIEEYRLNSIDAVSLRVDFLLNVLNLDWIFFLQVISCVA